MRPDPIHRHVPAPVAHRLGDRPGITILSLRDVLRALEGDGRVLLVAVCDTELSVAPILRAARDLDAVVGLAPGRAGAGPRDRHAFFESVCAAAEETGHRRALITVSPPVALTVADAELIAEQVYARVDAGFSHVPLDVSALAPEAAAPVVRRAAEALVDLELGLELRLAPGQEDAAGELAAGLKLLGVDLDLVGVAGEEGVGLAVVASEVDPVGVSWAEGGDAADLRGGLRNAVGAGVRLVSLRSPFTRELLAGLPEDLAARIAGAEGGVAEGLRAEAEALAALDPEARDRVEARVYAEAEELLRLLRLDGAHRRLRDRLLG